MTDDLKKKKPGEGEEVPAFTQGQIALIDKMFEDRLTAMKTSIQSSNPNSPISLYNLRDPKEIKTVKVSRFDAKWVLGFKNLQNDPYKKTPKYLRYGVEPIRKLNNEPYVTLLLSTDGKNIEEKEVLLVDYVENRDRVDVDVINVKVDPKIHDHGILGQSNQFAVAVNEKGNPEARPTIAAQSKSEERTFTVQLDGFEEPTIFISDFLG